MHTETVPRGGLAFCAAAIVLSLCAATAGRVLHLSDSQPTAAPVATRDLLFQDRSNGSVAIYDAAAPAAPIETIAPETNGFLRAAVRGLAQQRLRQYADTAVPFRLTAWADHRLTLEDSATGRRIEMEAFGSTNEAVFAQLLNLKTSP
jgi:putative photosynthetic complex assembly protein